MRPLPLRTSFVFDGSFKTLTFLFFLPFLLLCSASTAQADPFVIDTVGGSALGSGGVTNGPGSPNPATVGQTFTVAGGATRLDNFSFYIRHSVSTVNFQAYVYAWDGTKATGSQLYQSAIMITPATDTGYQQFTFDTGGIGLSSGSQYVVFLNSSYPFTAPIPFTGSSMPLQGDTYAGGNFVYLNNSTNFSQIFTTPWGNFDGTALQGSDLAFRAQFSTPEAVPEPATLILLGTGLAGVAAKVRRRRREA